MTLICVASPKGGVGKTMVAANLAYEMKRSGASHVIVVDLDSQNALRLHFGIPMSHREGLMACIAAGLSWNEAACRTSSDVIVFPFGAQSARDLVPLDAAMRARPEILTEQIMALSRAADTIVVVDTAPGYSVALSAVLSIADIVVTVMTAEASCIALLPEIHSGACYGLTSQDETRFLHKVVVNRFDPLNRINIMAMPQILRRLGPLHLGTIYRDEHVGEAFASQKLVSNYASFSRAATDLKMLGQQLNHCVRDR